MPTTEQVTTHDSPPNVLVIIPAYNEAANIAGVVAQVRASVPGADVCVVNDGSGDNTSQIAAAAGAIVLNLPYNLGIGAAVQTGFRYAFRQGYAVAVRIDGDDQHPPTSIPPLLAALAEDGADMVIGSRFLAAGDAGYKGSLPRRVGIRVLASVIGLITGQTVTDPTSGFLVANRRAISFCAHAYPHDYPEPEARVLMHRAGLRVREVPVVMRARAGGVSSITVGGSVYYMSKVLLALLI
ncbi:MAG: glycosyltransferase family 2 protein, partial [Anaerolineae bacterium]|nr:glycosyltransferase family 2 protein [Anaerolineae bacterium]